MKKRVILGVVILAIGTGLWWWTQSPKSDSAGVSSAAKPISVNAARKVAKLTAEPVLKQDLAAVVRPTTSKVVTSLNSGLTSVPASQRVNADGLLLAEDLAASDGTVRIQKRYYYSADKILARELEISVSDGATTAVDYLVTSAGKVLLKVTDEKGNITVE